MDLISKIEAFVGDRYARCEYPVLQHQFQDWSASKPLQGLKVLDATPLFANTLLKHRALIAGGAELTIGLSDFISYDKGVLEFVRDELRVNVVDNAVGHYDVVADCAGAYIDACSRFGYVELTRSGVDKYAAKGATTYVADSSIIKRLETEIGTGDSYFRAMEHLGYSSWSGARLVVFGGGKVGRGIVSQARVRGVDVVVVSEPVAGQSVVDYKDSAAVEAVVKSADFVVMATGVEGAFEKTVNVELVNCGAVFANMGAQDEFGDSVPGDKVLCGKRTINFILSEPTSMCYIDATMALHNYGAAFLASGVASGGLIFPSADIEQSMLQISAQNGVIGKQISMILG